MLAEIKSSKNNNQINQNHTGKGDNIGRDKINNYNSMTINNIIYKENISIEKMFSMGLKYLESRLYTPAINNFINILKLEPYNSETYLYYSIALLNGKKAFLNKFSTIKIIENNMHIALKVKKKALYYYFFSYIKYDFYERKSLKTSPNYTELLSLAKKNSINESEILLLFNLMNISIPEILKFNNL